MFIKSNYINLVILMAALFWTERNSYAVNILEDILTFQAHGDSVTSVDFRHNTNIVASSDEDGNIFVWDADSNTIIHKLNEDKFSVSAIAFSPDGSKLVSGQLDGKIRLWDANKWHQLRVMDIDEGIISAVKSITFSPDGKFIISGGKTIKLWDTDTGKIIRVMQGNGGMLSMIESVAFSPDGKILVTGRSSINDQVVLWDSSTGNLMMSFNEHLGAVTCLKFTSDNTVFISGSIDSSIKIWDINNRVVRKTLTGHRKGWASGITDIDISKDNRFIVSVADSDNYIKIWDIEKGREIFSVNGHNSPIYSVKFNHNSSLLATASNDKVKIWKVNLPK
jgi:WD40 repeat protein